MIPMLIVLDGPKGAGKSSVGKILIGKLTNAVSLSLDEEKSLLENQNQDRSELFREAFENTIQKARKLLEEGGSVIVDCGVTPERLLKLDQLALDTGSKFYKFLLKASRDTLLSRVRLRDSAKNKKTDVERFDEVFDLIHGKEFEGFHIIQTDKIDLESVADSIIKIVS